MYLIVYGKLLCIFNNHLKLFNDFFECLILHQVALQLIFKKISISWLLNSSNHEGKISEILMTNIQQDVHQKED